MSDGFKDSGKRSSFETGAHRDLQDGKGRMDLLPFQALMKVSKVFEEGAKKYRANNWRRGIPLSRYADSGMRHMSKWMMGMRDEPHLDMACWNFLCLIETQELIKQGLLPEELNDLPYNPLCIEDNPLELPELDLPLEGVELDEVGKEETFTMTASQFEEHMAGVRKKEACKDETGDAFYAAQAAGLCTGNSIYGSILSEEDLLKARQDIAKAQADKEQAELDEAADMSDCPGCEEPGGCDGCDADAWGGEVPVVTQKAAQMGFTNSVARQMLESRWDDEEWDEEEWDEYADAIYNDAEAEALAIKQEISEYVPLETMLSFVMEYGPEDTRVLAKGAKISGMSMTKYVDALKEMANFYNTALGEPWSKNYDQDLKDQSQQRVEELFKPEEGLEGKR